MSLVGKEIEISLDSHVTIVASYHEWCRSILLASTDLKQQERSFTMELPVMHADIIVVLVVDTSTFIPDDLVVSDHYVNQP